MSTRLTWHGASIQTNANEAARIGIDQTMADCVAHAQQPPPMGAPYEFGWLRNNITFAPAIRQGNRTVGRWGNLDGPDYALIQEMRTTYLRRAADAMYPTLQSRIQENIR